MSIDALDRRFCAPRVARAVVEISEPLMIAVIDIVGSTGLARRIGDLAYAAVIERFREGARMCAELHGGREFASTGDGFIHLYDLPEAAVEATVAIFRANEYSLDRREPVDIRAGIHRGRLVRSSSGLIGLALNDACELGQKATARELWLSNEAQESLGDKVSDDGAKLVSMPKSGWREVHSVPWAAETEDADFEVEISAPAVVLDHEWEPAR